MRKTLIVVATAVALAASPALAQGRGGGHGGGGAGGGPGGGMGAGPPISPPGRSDTGDRGASASAREIAAQRGEFGRDFAGERRTTERQAMAHERRALAMQYAEAARAGRRLPANADREIRAALRDDIDAWREEFRVGRDQWQAMRDQWIVDRDTLTPEQWAQRRADWFATRDAWIARNKAHAQSRDD